MTRTPDSDHEALQAVYEAARSGNHAQAGQLAASALARGLEHPLVLNVAALRLEQQGRPHEALRLLQRAVQVAPDDTASRNALGLCLLQLERADEAVEQFEMLLRLNPSLPYAHTSRGNALLARGSISEAEESYRRALALDDRQGMAFAGLAHIAADRGAYHQARDLAEKALALLPGLPDAIMTRAAAELGERLPARAESRMRALLDGGALSGEQRAMAMGLLGDILDALGRPDEAIEAYTACNEELRNKYAGVFGGSGSALEYVRGLTRYFERADPDVWGPPAPAGANSADVKGHVFLIGFPRSGTTLLEVILEGHPNVVSLEERELLIDSVRQFMQQPPDLERLWRATPAALEAARSAYWRRVAAEGCEVAGAIFVDKHPLNTLKLPLIARLFPNAKVLFACRDPRDIVLSCFRHRFRMSAPIFELLSIESSARYYDAVMRLLVRMMSLFTLDTCLVRHEDVVTEFAREMKRVCTFLGLEWAPAMGDFGLRARDRGVLTPSTAQLVRGLSTEGVGQWQRYRSHLAPVQALLEQWVQRFYYTP